MPGMPRKKGKARKIAFSILGVPDNIRFQKSIYTTKIRKRLKFEDGRLSK